MEANEPHNPMQNTTTIYQQKSEFTLLVYFKNNKTGHKFHSWKQENRKIAGHDIKDLRYALNRLTHLVEKEYLDKYKTAMIYHNPSGEKIIQWNYNVLKEKVRYKWLIDTKGNVLFKLDQTPVENIQQVMGNLNTEMKYKH